MARNIGKTIARFGDRRLCPICHRASGKFLPYGVRAREDAQCPHCESLERHRLLWLYVSKETNLLDGAPKRMLHIAPEPVLEKRLAKQPGIDYLTADLNDPRAMIKMDITNIEFPDGSFDVIFCSHVLEHVPDDRSAMRELGRVLKDDGWAIMLVPITAETTFEDPSIVDPLERIRLFGQEDHVRVYGRDFVDRLRESGFEVQTKEVKDLVSAQDAIRMGLTAATGEIFVCTKRIGGSHP